MANRKFSVLLLYPDYANDGGQETYYAHVKAHNSACAIEAAQMEAAEANGMANDERDDFHPLLVLNGHQRGL